MKMIYISHPFTGNEEQNRRNAAAIAARLAKEHPNIVFINPLDTMRHTDETGLDYDTVLAQCAEIMRRCDGVIMAGYWEQSHGCREELEQANELGKPVWDVTAAFSAEWDGEE